MKWMIFLFMLTPLTFGAKLLQQIDSTSATGLFALSIALNKTTFIAGSQNSTGTYEGVDFPYAGVVNLYEYDSLNGWLEKSPLVSKYASTNPRMGGAVALQDSTLLSCGVFYNSLQGVCAVFELDPESGWTETDSLVDSLHNTNQFGGAVALSPSENLAVVTTSSNPIVFQKTDKWNLTQKIIIEDSSASGKFWNVEVNDDLILVLDNYYSLNYKDSAYWKAGAIYVFQRQLNKQFELIQKILPIWEETVYPISEGISLDGNTLVFGVQNDGVGEVVVMNFDGNEFTKTQKIRSVNASDTYGFGRKVVVNGNRLVVGSSHENFDENQGDSIPIRGRVYLYERKFDGAFNEVSYHSHQNAVENDAYGQNLALSSEFLVATTRTNYIKMGFYKLEAMEDVITANITQRANASIEVNQSLVRVDSKETISKVEMINMEGQVVKVYNNINQNQFDISIEGARSISIIRLTEDSKNQQSYKMIHFD